MTTVRPLESLSPTQRSDMERLCRRVEEYVNKVREAPTEAKRREFSEFCLRAAAELYSWSH